MTQVNTYPIEFQLQVIKKNIVYGHSVQELAFRYNIAPESIKKWLSRYQRTHRQLDFVQRYLLSGRPAFSLIVAKGPMG